MPTTKEVTLRRAQVCSCCLGTIPAAARAKRISSRRFLGPRVYSCFKPCA